MSGRVVLWCVRGADAVQRRRANGSEIWGWGNSRKKKKICKRITGYNIFFPFHSTFTFMWKNVCIFRTDRREQRGGRRKEHCQTKTSLGWGVVTESVEINPLSFSWCCRVASLPPQRMLYRVFSCWYRDLTMAVSSVRCNSISSSRSCVAKLLIVSLVSRKRSLRREEKFCDCVLFSSLNRSKSWLEKLRSNERK